MGNVYAIFVNYNLTPFLAPSQFVLNVGKNSFYLQRELLLKKRTYMANYQELANLVWNVADDVLRGLFKPHEYGDITLPFLVLRRLDCILEEDGRKEKSIETYNRFKDQVPEDRLPPIILRAINTSFYNTSQYDLSRLKADPNNSPIAISVG